MRISPMAPAAGLVLILGGLAGCDAPVGTRGAAVFEAPVLGEYQGYLRNRAGRRDIPYSIPPETGAPLAAPGTAALPQTALPPPASARTAALPVSPMPAPATAQPAAAAPPPAAPAEGAPLRPPGVAANTYTPVPFGQRPAGAEIPPQGTTEIVTVATVPTGAADRPNVVGYALSTSHPVGTPRYARRNPLRHMRWQSACLAFVSQDAAQEAFLAAGGPERDRHNLDPDGDGYACWWDPDVYRRAANLPAPVPGGSTE